MRKQITKILPRSKWSDIVIIENNEPLVPVIETDTLKTGLILKGYETSFLVRKSVRDKLYQVSQSLPQGMCLLVIEGYRSVEDQKKSWDSGVEIRRFEQPNVSIEEIERQVSLVTARPNTLANHNCGGAVDVTLIYQDGTKVDMGTPYPSEIKESISEIQKKYRMFTNTFLKRRITKEQELHRKILRERMEEQGFVWYPGEWWHFCYGDRMWAVYTKQKECMYGPVSKQLIQNGDLNA
jgi:D-alanyl-D-alanine dipeptidase